jgi:hypothetical protein
MKCGENVYVSGFHLGKSDDMLVINKIFLGKTMEMTWI